MKRLNFRLAILLLCLYSCTKEKPSASKKPDNVFYNQAAKYRDLEKLDSAFLYFSKGKEFSLKQKDSLGIAKCLVNMSLISSNNGDYFGAQELSLEAIPYLNHKNKDHHVYIQANYNELGLVSEHLARYKEAINFYEQCLPYAKDDFTKLIVNNNIANVYRRLKDYPKALALYKAILKKNVSALEYARILSNLAFTKWLANPQYNASRELTEALQIRLNKKDLWGQNASYAHFSDYHSEKRPDSALFYALKMYQIATQLNSPDDKQQALQKLITLGPASSTKRYFILYNKIDDSLKTARNASKNQFALIRYETEKSKAANLILQKDNTEKEYQLIKRETLIAGLLVLLIVTGIVGNLLYKRRKKRLQFEAATLVKENQLKTSKKVHDVVANGLYRVMKTIENQDKINKEEILDSIDFMYQKSRDISYEVEIPQKLKQTFAERLAHLSSSFSSLTTVVNVKGNTDLLWLNVNEESKYEIEHILQELLVNMRKHSQAKKVDLTFENENQHIQINYADDGIGMKKATQFKNGLTNTVNRIKSLNGEITFDTETDSGLKIQISIQFS